MSDFKFSIEHPVKPSSLPSDESVFAAGDLIIASVPSWKPGKTYHDVVKTWSRPKESEDGAPWHCRISKHSSDEVTFDILWSKLGVNKAENEIQFIPEINKVTKVLEVSPTQSIWSMYYKFTPPVSPRVFTELQVTRLQGSAPGSRIGTVVSIPVDLSSSEDQHLASLLEKGVQGRYVSVEQVREMGTGEVEWLMATSSTPGGNIPSFVAEASMGSSISADVPHLLSWLKKGEEAK